MKIFLLLIFTSVMFFTGHHPESTSVPRKALVATCYGYKNCTACSSCNYCGHCNSGGSCGVCCSASTQPAKPKAGKKSTVKSSGFTSSASSQCQGITKKGARCKRMVKGGGYCYQHG